ncbi:hypothetical protein HK103_006766 [Boothiomyces macroporosus]|uniref:Nudix hydrolase domain-containing protein n=1 Tax=Boothiomyces macroporosus TaxID=261099 RepID=A0AAD5UGX9_9FUNG|nr:hypothetical protein HK103_006766 [Boothiomyces macroporosus]
MNSTVLHPLSGYSFGAKDPQMEPDQSIQQKLERLKTEFVEKGCRITVLGVICLHEHNHPTILVLRIANSFYKLPGGTLKPGEDEIKGLQQHLIEQLGPIGDTNHDEFEIGELLGVYYRLNFENILVLGINVVSVSATTYYETKRDCKDIYGAFA